MKKSLFTAIVIFSLISFSSASIQIIDKDIKDRYSIGEKISGTLVLEIINESIDSIIKFSPGRLISIKDFLRETNQPYSCIPYDCSYKYTALNQSLSKRLFITESNESLFGFIVRGEKVRITDLDFNLSSNFPEEEQIPLKLDFFRRAVWEYKEPSENYNNKLWGCYNEDILDNGIGIYPHEKFEIVSNAEYCERIHLPESGYIQTGARIEGTSQNELKIDVYESENPANKIASCSYLPQTGFCRLSRDNWYKEGDFYFCLGLNNPNERVVGTLGIFRENYRDSCGWYVPKGYNLNQMILDNSTIDYSIFARTGKYAAAKDITIRGFEINNLLESANNYLNLTYKNKCSSGCVMPIFASGTDQLLEISDAKIGYEIISSSGGMTSDYRLYDLSKQSARFDYVYGTVKLDDLDITANTSGNYSFTLNFNENKIFEVPIKVFSESSILNLYPKNPPAGLNTKFTANIKSDAGIIKYEWNFGDGETAQTAVNIVEHIYKSTGNHTLILKITDANKLEISKNFTISSVIPTEFINRDLSIKFQRLENLTLSIASLPIWYQGEVKDKINFSYYQDELLSLRNQNSQSISDSQLIDVFTRLQNLYIPSYVFISEKSLSQIATALDSINPQIIADYTGENIENSGIEDYKSSILNWQNKNLISQLNKTKIAYFDGQDNIKPVLGIYSLILKPRVSNELYLVINQNTENIKFRSEEDPVGLEKESLIEFAGEKQVDFFDITGEDLSLFVSPRLSSLNIISKIEKCDFDNVCEKGENSNGCRTDCKPFDLAVVYFVFLFIAVFFLYSFIAWWYKNRYEWKLFADKKQSYNITMFILNSRAGGASDWSIREILKQKGWNSEQISFGFKRANGQRIGFPEIIPIEKIKLFFMKIKAKSSYLNNPTANITKW
jgi:PKD repeat protein